MTIFRNPVDGVPLPPPLKCVDIDPLTRIRTSDLCRDQWTEHKKGSFKCRNRGGPKECRKSAFLYPRKRRSNGDFHFHQGIDIGNKPGLMIRSVTSGRVVVAIREFTGGWSHYGKIVVVESDTVPYYFLYAHCQMIKDNIVKGTYIREKQEIGTTGRTFYNKKNPTELFTSSKPHLHFEVLTSIKGAVRDKETQLGDDKTRTDPSSQPRLDPLYVLEQLGPWGMTEVYVPKGDKLDPDTAKFWNNEVESSPNGGFFPLGANNHWHGGVHRKTPIGSDLVAPFDATIVAARLDPDPTYANQPDGSINFILLRHEIPEAYFALFQRNNPEYVEPKPTKTPTLEDRAVGQKSRCANLPEDVVVVKKKLHEHLHHDVPYYKPEDDSDLEDGSSVTDALEKAIKTFQANEVTGIKKNDGIVDIPGKTWKALHDGAPPKEPEHPTATGDLDTPEPTLDERRVLYSLLMHLQPLPITNALAKEFPWLTEVEIDSDPDTPDPAEEDVKKAEEQRKREHEEDIAEAADRQLVGSVGAATSDGVPADDGMLDVRWVYARLVRFGYHPGPIKITSDEELISAIREFQNHHHNAFKNKKNGDGRVDPGGGTEKLLHKTKTEVLSGSGGKKSKVDPVFVHRTAVRDDDDVAKVITGLDVKVQSGAKLWRSGQAMGYVDNDRSLVMLEQIHWEMFSEHLLVSGWDDLIDEDEDGDGEEDDHDEMSAKIPDRIMEYIESTSPEGERDGLLTIDEIRDLYRSGRGEFLRRTPCRFVNHWGLDVDKAVAKITSMDFDTKDLAKRLRPQMWWEQATDVLPSTRLVWHYNPIELLAEYAEHLASMKPPPKANPDTHPTLVVQVLYANGTYIPDATVELLHGIAVKRVVRTSSNGEARFVGVEVGEYGVRLSAPTITTPIAVELPPTVTTEVEIPTDLPAPPLPRGTIKVTVRKYTKTIAGDDIEVWLSHADTGPVTNSYTSKGKLQFEDIVHGDYAIQAGDAETIEVTLDKKKKNATVILPAPIGVLRMELKIGKSVGPRQMMEVRKKGRDPVSKLTDGSGVAEFELPDGHYKVWVGDHKKGVRVHGDTTTKYTMKLSEKNAPEPAPEEEEEGTLVVTVIDYVDDEPLGGEVVFVSPLYGDEIPLSQYTDDSGLAEFELSPGEYLVEVGDESVTRAVSAWSTTSVELEVDT